MNPKQFGEKTQYKNTTTRQLRDGMQVICLNQGLKIENAFKFAHDLNPEVIYEENDGSGTLNQWVVKESVILNTNITTNVVLTSLNKTIFLRPFGGDTSIENYKPAKYLKISIAADFGTMAAGVVLPSFGAADLTTLPVINRFTLTPLKGNYKPIEIQARLVNPNATAMSFEFSINGVITPAIDIIYSPTLITYPIPTLSQITTDVSKIQYGFLSNHLSDALEGYVIYELVN